MPLYRRLLICGLILVSLPIVLKVTESILSRCYEYAYAHSFLELVLNISRQILDVPAPIVGLVILVGLTACIISFVLFRRKKGVSWPRVVGDAIGVILLTLIISSLFLASLNAGRSKGPVAGIKSYVSSLRAEAELYYDTKGGSYAGFCSGDQVSKVTEYVMKSDKYGGALCKVDEAIVDCKDSEKSFAASVKLPRQYAENKYFCVDQTGFARETGGPLTGPQCTDTQ